MARIVIRSYPPSRGAGRQGCCSEHPSAHLQIKASIPKGKAILGNNQQSLLEYNVAENKQVSSSTGALVLKTSKYLHIHW